MEADETKEPYFGALVIGKAISNTRRLFESKIRDAIFGTLLLAIGGISSWYWQRAKAVEVNSSIYFIVTSLWPIGLVVLIAFFWNLWLAPSELAYEAWHSHSPRRDVLSRQSPIPVNWSIWQKRSEYKVSEFGSILAKEDPAGLRISTQTTSFIELIMEEIRSKKLSYIPRYYKSGGMTRNEIPLNADYNRIKKDAAISWAESQSFDVSHIK